MPRPPNAKSRIAQIRASLGMKVEDFAASIDQSPAMLRQVESGAKKMPLKMAESVAQAWGLPVCYVTGEKDFPNGVIIERAGSAGYDDFAPIRALRLFGDILSLYCQASKLGINGDLALIPIRREMEKFAERWGIPLSDIESGGDELIGIMLPRGEYGRREDLIDSPGNRFLKELSRAKPVIDAQRANDRRGAEIDSTIKAAKDRSTDGQDRVVRVALERADMRAMRNLRPAKKKRRPGN